MIDIALIRTDKETIKKRLETRNKTYPQIDQVFSLDNEWRKIKTEIQKIYTERNANTEKIKELINSNKKDELAILQETIKKSKQKLSELEKKEAELKEQINTLSKEIPNIPDLSVPNGKDENDNIEVNKFSQPTKFNFPIKAHWDLANDLKLVDFTRATKISGSRYTIYVGAGAKLIRALQAFTLDMNTKAGFKEYLPPVIINASALYGTGQLPKFEEDLYGLKTGNQYLSPTAEVQLTNLFSNEILSVNELPMYLTASTACFRSEAGSAGKDTKGVIRQHQFYKTEMVKLTKQETSFDELESMTRQAELILEALQLPYRRIVLCTGDMGFASAKTYDIEVWLPSYNAYKEISSCSNCLDFQARNLMLRYRDENNEIKYCHTLNGSGLAIDRLWAAVVENYQQKDGSIKIPEKLLKYFDGEQYIK